MSNFKMLVTNEGKHPANKWAELAADEIVEISAQAPTTLMKEALDFRKKLVETLTRHHQHMMDHEQEQIKAGKHGLDLPYETEDHAEKVADEICGLSAGTSFEDHFKKDDTWSYVNAICNKFFKSAKLVERHHYHSEKAKSKK